MAKYSEELASLMREAIKNKSQRQIAKEAGVSQTTIGNMVLGMIPSEDICSQVAPAIDKDENEVLAICGYLSALKPIDQIRYLLKKNWPYLEQEDKELIESVIEKREVGERMKRKDKE